jgi:hypothetical protein
MARQGDWRWSGYEFYCITSLLRVTSQICGHADGVDVVLWLLHDWDVR